MLEALKNSPEKKELVELAAKYLRGVKGTLVQQKKRDREKAMAQGGNNLNIRPAQYQSTATAYQGPPQRQVPPAYNGPVSVAPGSVGDHLARPGQQQQQRPNQASVPFNGQEYDDHAVASALRGFLGQG
jgi:hypothetical protein